MFSPTGTYTAGSLGDSHADIPLDTAKGLGDSLPWVAAFSGYLPAGSSITLYMEVHSCGHDVEEFGGFKVGSYPSGASNKFDINVHAYRYLATANNDQVTNGKFTAQAWVDGTNYGPSVTTHSKTTSHQDVSKYLGRAKGGAEGWAGRVDATITYKCTATGNYRFDVFGYTECCPRGANYVSLEATNITVNLPEDYDITYNSNYPTGCGKSNSSFTDKKYKDVSYTVLDNMFDVPTGYYFNGWDSKSVGSTYTSNSSLTLNAQWARRSYTYSVNVQADGPKDNISYKVIKTDSLSGSTSEWSTSSGQNYSGTYYYGDTYEVTRTSTPERYNVSSSGSLSGTITTSGASGTLIYTTKTYNITYDFNGGIDGPPNGTKKWGDTYYIGWSSDEWRYKKPKKQFYVFDYWRGDNGEEYDSGEGYSNNSNLALKAHYIEGKMVEFNPNKGKIRRRGEFDGDEQKPLRTVINGSSNIYYYNDVDNLDWTKPSGTTRRGYTLLSWYDRQYGGERVIGLNAEHIVGSYFNSAGEWIK